MTEAVPARRFALAGGRLWRKCDRYKTIKPLNQYSRPIPQVAGCNYNFKYARILPEAVPARRFAFLPEVDPPLAEAGGRPLAEIRALQIPNI